MRTAHRSERRDSAEVTEDVTIILQLYLRSARAKHTHTRNMSRCGFYCVPSLLHSENAVKTHISIHAHTETIHLYSLVWYIIYRKLKK